MPANSVSLWKLKLIKWSKKTSSSGFTLIELMVVIVTLVIVFGVGFASFRGTQKRQELSNASLLVKSDIRYAQELALAGKKPTGCNMLNGYVFDSTAANRYRIVANCNNNVTITVPELPEINITTKFPGVSMPVFTDVFFNVLGRGVKTNSDITITLTNTTGSQLVTVTKGGEIN